MLKRGRSNRRKHLEIWKYRKIIIYIGGVNLALTKSAEEKLLKYLNEKNIKEVVVTAEGINEYDDTDKVAIEACGLDVFLSISAEESCVIF